MQNVSIQHSRVECRKGQTNRLLLDATVRGKPRTIIVDIGRYEKRPVFIIHDIGEIADYQIKQMNELLLQVVLEHSKVMNCTEPFVD